MSKFTVRCLDKPESHPGPYRLSHLSALMTEGCSNGAPLRQLPALLDKF